MAKNCLNNDVEAIPTAELQRTFREATIIKSEAGPEWLGRVDISYEAAVSWEYYQSISIASRLLN